MKYILIIYFLSTGFHSERFVSMENCEDALLEARYVRGPYDLWSGVCMEPDENFDITAITRGIGP